MPEYYAARYEDGKIVGKYKTKADYERGKLSSFGRATKSAKRSGNYK